MFAKRLLLGLAVAGLLCTAIAGAIVGGERSDAAQANAERIADSIARDTALAVSELVEVTAGLARLTEANRLTEGEFQTSWSASLGYPGESFAYSIVAVSPEDLDAFIDAEQALVPGLEVSYRNEQPPDVGHLIILSSSDVTPYRGADLSVLPSLADTVAQIERGESELSWTNPRNADAVDGFARVIHGQSLSGADGRVRRAWTMVVLDMRVDFERLEREFPGAGFRVTADGAGGLGEYGVAPSSSVARASAQATDGDVTVDVDTWIDGSGVALPAVGTVWLSGLLGTAGLMALVAGALAIRRLVVRVGRSDQDARHDSLTGLPNRRWLAEFLTEHQDETLAVLFCDLDRFKVVNDSGGHGLGDELLVEVGRRLESALDERSVVGRYGGDEFIIVMRSVTPEPDAAGLARRVHNTLNEPFQLSAGEWRASASIGIAIARAGSGRVPDQELIRQADVALGTCKQTRRGGFVIYDACLKEAELDRLVLERDLQAALDSGGFVVHFQPIVDWAGTTVSFEALVRWQRGGSLVPPGIFLPVVADIGRMADLGAIVLEQAVATFSAGLAERDDDDESVTLHVNVDAAQLLTPSFTGQVAALLAVHDFDPALLVLELTEGRWLDSSEQLARVFEELAALGVGLAVDDFGAGYSSLSRLFQIPGLTEIKFDGSIVRDAMHSQTHEILTGMVQGIRAIGMSVVAERIENVDELETAKSMGVNHFQGYFFAKPGPAEEVGLLRRNESSSNALVEHAA